MAKKTPSPGAIFTCADGYRRAAMSVEGAIMERRFGYRDIATDAMPPREYFVPIPVFDALATELYFKALYLIDWGKPCGDWHHFGRLFRVQKKPTKRRIRELYQELLDNTP